MKSISLPAARTSIGVHRSPFLISFSGIDGAGKTTQIMALTDQLLRSGARVRHLAFWDDVVVLRNFRESSSHTFFKGDKGAGSPTQPLNRRDKNVQAWYLTLSRLFLYTLDAVRLSLLVAGFKKTSFNGDVDVVIFDRYIYDELANLPLNNWLVRGYVRMLLKLAPAPGVAYVLDADPALARDRKPEYPFDFLVHNRQSYLSLSALAGGLEVIEALPVDEVTRSIAECLHRNPRFQHLSSTF